MTATAGSAEMAAKAIDFNGPVAIALGAMLLLALLVTAPFLRGNLAGKKIEMIAGLWTLVLYLTLGLVPLLLR